MILTERQAVSLKYCSIKDISILYHIMKIQKVQIPSFDKVLNKEHCGSIKLPHFKAAQIWRVHYSCNIQDLKAVWYKVFAYQMCSHLGADCMFCKEHIQDRQNLCDCF